MNGTCPRRRIVTLTAMAGVLVGAVWTPGCKPAEQQAAKRERAVNVRVKTLTYEPISEQITLPGNVEGWREVDIASEVQGRIGEIRVKEGDPVSRWVPEDLEAASRFDAAATQIAELQPTVADTIGKALKKDGILVQIEHGEQKQVAIEAAASAVLGRRTLAQARDMYAKNALSRVELDQAGANDVTLQARFRRTVLNLQKCNIGSPIAGIVDRLPFERGEYVKAGDVVARVVQVDKVKVIVDMPERDVPFVKEGQKLNVTFDHIAEPITGTVIFVGLVADDATRTYPVKIEVLNPRGRIRPRMIARVKFVKQRVEKALTIDRFAVLPSKEKYYVYVLNGGKANRRPVELGILEGRNQQLIVPADTPEELRLKPGDRVIVDARRVQQGRKVVVKKDVAGEDTP